MSLFIVIEGLDGSGKSTLCRRLATHYGPQLELFREPGSHPTAEKIRGLLKDPTVDLTPLEETLLFSAARSVFVRTRLLPALQQPDRIVLLDRYIPSTVAYQGSTGTFDRELIWQIADHLPEPALHPDAVILLDLSVDQALERAGQSGDTAGDRLEAVDRQTWDRRAAAYSQMLDDSQITHQVDASRPAAAVFNDVRFIIEQLLHGQRFESEE